MHGNVPFDVFCFKLRVGVLALGWIKNPKNSRVNNLVRKVSHAPKGACETLRTKLYPIWIKFCRMVGDDRLTGLGVEGIKFCHSHRL